MIDERSTVGPLNFLHVVSNVLSMRSFGGLGSLFVAIFVFSLSAAQAENSKTVRIAVVNTPQFSGLMQSLATDFSAKYGTHVEIYGGGERFRSFVISRSIIQNMRFLFRPTPFCSA